MTDKEKGNRVNALAMTFLEELQMRPHPFADQILRAYKAGYHQSEKDSLPEEPDWLQELHCKLDSLSKEDFEKVWAKYHQKEEPVSEDLEEEAEKYLEEHIKGGSATERSGFKAWGKHIARHFAEWQKQQMMIDSISCEVEWYDGLYLNFTQETLDEVLSNKGIEAGNKVKVIVLKA